MSGKAGGSVGSYTTIKGDGELSGTVKDFPYYLFSQYYNTHGYRLNSHVQAHDYNGRVGFVKSDDLVIDMVTGWHDDNYGMPGGLSDSGALETLGRRGSSHDKDFASTKDRFAQISLDKKLTFDDTYLGGLGLDLSYRNRDTYYWFDYGCGRATASKAGIDTYTVNGNYQI